MLGFNATGHLALGQVADAATTTTVLVASGGAFSLVGNVATFRVQMPLSVGAFTYTGNGAALTPTLVAGVGSFVEGGGAVTFKVSWPQAAGSFALTGYSPVLSVILSAQTGQYVLSGANVPLFIRDGEIMFVTWEGRTISVSDLGRNDGVTRMVVGSEARGFLVPQQYGSFTAENRNRRP